MKHLAIIGCGWLGRHLINALPEDWTISATTAHRNTADALNARGYVYDWTQDDLPEALATASHFVIAIPPTAGGYERYAQHLRRLAKQLPKDCPIILISSSSAYPSEAGVYTENSAPNPASPVYQGEAALRDVCEQVIILRCSGLIGADRVLGARFFTQACDKPNARLNLVHQQDVCAAIQTLLAQPILGATYNLAHPDHILRHDFYRLMAEVCGYPEPVFTNHERSPDRLINAARITDDTAFAYANRTLSEYFCAPAEA